MTGGSRGEFSRPLSVADIPVGGRVLELSADDGERIALAERFGLLRVGGLEATVRIQPLAQGRLRLRAEFRAQVEQSCVVTLEPVAGRIEGAIDCLFAPEAAPEGQAPENAVVDFDVDDPDPPEPITDGLIDPGEIVAQHFGLELDPFPRAPGARLEDVIGASGEGQGEPERDNPYQRLADLKIEKK